MTDWSSLKPLSCRECSLLNQPGPCWGEGDPQRAKFIYIAQNPGREEVQASPMRPLVGPSGRVFNRQLFEAGVRREELFITNQVKCLTPDNREPTDSEVRCCKPLLQKELQVVKADTVVLAGALAARHNLGSYSSLLPNYRPEGGLFERMGCVERKDERKWIITLHPAFIMRMPDFKQAAVDHLKKAWLLSGVPLSEIKINEWPLNQEVLQLVDYICLQSREFADDVETVGLQDVEEDDYVGGDFIVTMCGVGAKPYEALVLTPDQISLMKPAFDDPLIVRDEHNGQYDQYHLEKFLGELRNKTFDTMLATHYLRSHLPKKLKPFVLSQYTCLPYYQGAGSRKDNLGKINMRFYNGMDIITTLLAAREQRRQLQQWGLEELFNEFGMPLLPILEEWRRKGVNVDLKAALKIKKLIEARIEQAEATSAKLCGPLNSITNPHFAKTFFYETHGLPPQYNDDPKNRGAKKVTTDFEARKRLRKWIEASEERMTKYKVPYLALQLADFIAGERKKLEYIGRISPDGRIHAYYKAHGTMVFRLSSSPNLQNFPVYSVLDWGGARRDDSDEENIPIEEDKGSGEIGSLRSIVIPDNPQEDWILTCDFEQLQLWIYTWLADVKWLKAIYESREYIYGVVYEKLYKPDLYFIPGEARTKEFKAADVSEQRIRRAKAVPLGFLFGRQAEAVAKEYGWTLQEAQALRHWWFENCPELLKSYSETKYQMQQKGYIKHAFGQLIHYPSQKLNTAINNKAQSNEAFIVNQSIILIDRELTKRGLKKHGVRSMLGVHDSISFNSPTRFLPELYEDIVKPVLERPISQLNGLILRHSAEVSKQWDWNVIKYPKWKKEHYEPGYGVGAASASGNQSTGRSEI